MAPVTIVLDFFVQIWPVPNSLWAALMRSNIVGITHSSAPDSLHLSLSTNLN